MGGKYIIKNIFEKTNKEISRYLFNNLFMKKIIVLLAAYNGEKYIKEQILSIVNQTLKPSLIIINIDKSNDKTLKIIEDCILNYPIIKISKNKNSSRRMGCINKIW